MKNLRFSGIEYPKEERLQSGFIELDRITQGWENGSLTIIAAHSAMGKTTFGISMISNIAIRNKIPVALFSLEMFSIQVMRRSLSNLSSIEVGKIMASESEESTILNSAEQHLLNDAKTQLENAPIYLDDTPSLSVQNISVRITQLVQAYQIRLIVIDYLQLMNACGASFDSRVEEIAIIIRTLKALAKNLNIPIIVFSQLDRIVGGNEIPEGRRPLLKDFGKYEVLEQDADMICFIHRPEYYGVFEDCKGGDFRGKALIIVAKNRNGQTGDIVLKFAPEICRFQNIDE